MDYGSCPAEHDQIYLTPVPKDMIAAVTAFHARRGRQAPPVTPATGAGYRPETLETLFGTTS